MQWMLYEILMDIVVAKKVFQRRLLEEDWKALDGFFDYIRRIFGIERGIYFLKIKEVKAAKDYWAGVYISFFFSKNWSVMDLNIQETTLLSIDGLKRSLHDSNIKHNFSDINNYITPIYKKFEANDATMNRADYILAVTHCQINCIARKFHWILDFIKSQNACGRMNIVEESAVKSDKLKTKEKKQKAKGNASKSENKKNNTMN